MIMPLIMPFINAIINILPSSVGIIFYKRTLISLRAASLVRHRELSGLISYCLRRSYRGESIQQYLYSTRRTCRCFLPCRRARASLEDLFLNILHCNIQTRWGWLLPWQIRGIKPLNKIFGGKGVLRLLIDPIILHVLFNASAILRVHTPYHSYMIPYVSTGR